MNPIWGSEECLTGSLPFDQDEFYEDFAHRIGHIEEQYTRIEDILPSKLDIAYDLQSVLGATEPWLQAYFLKCLFSTPSPV